MEFECSKPNFISAFLRISLHCSAFRYNSMKLAAIHCHISKPLICRKENWREPVSNYGQFEAIRSQKRFSGIRLVAFVWSHSLGDRKICHF